MTGHNKKKKVNILSRSQLNSPYMGVRGDGSQNSLHSGRHFEGRSLETLVEDSQMQHSSPPSSPDVARSHNSPRRSLTNRSPPTRSPPTVVARATPSPSRTPPSRSPPSRAPHAVVATPKRRQTVNEALSPSGSPASQGWFSSEDLAAHDKNPDDDGWSSYFDDEDPHYSPSIDAALSEVYTSKEAGSNSWESYFQWSDEEERRKASLAAKGGKTSDKGKKVKKEAAPPNQARHHHRKARERIPAGELARRRRGVNLDPALLESAVGPENQYELIDEIEDEMMDRARKESLLHPRGGDSSRRERDSDEMSYFKDDDDDDVDEEKNEVEGDQENRDSRRGGRASIGTQLDRLREAGGGEPHIPKSRFSSFGE